MIVAGVWRLATGGIEPIRYTAGQQGLLHAGGAAGAVTVFLVLRAFASGTTALTGVEAISNGVSAFRAPEAVNAKKTLMVMAAIMGTLFLGITYLAVRLGALPFESGYPTVVSQIARQVLGDGPAFLLVQAATLLILVLAANTAFSGFPLLASFASGDALLPRQLRKRGHRLVYSNGIIALSAVAIFLIVVFKADVHALIPLYAVGVVTSFTLAQAGMTRRHLRCGARLAQRHRHQRDRGRGDRGRPGGDRRRQVRRGRLDGGDRHPAAGLAAAAHPADLRPGGGPAQGAGEPAPGPPKPRHEVMVLIEDLDQAALSALQYARQLNPLTITALHVAVDPDHARELGRLWPRSRSRSLWSWSTPPTGTCWPPSRRRWPSGSAPTPRSPSWSRAAATSASGAGSSTTRPRPA